MKRVWLHLLIIHVDNFLDTKMTIRTCLVLRKSDSLPLILSDYLVRNRSSYQWDNKALILNTASHDTLARLKLTVPTATTVIIIITGIIRSFQIK